MSGRDPLKIVGQTVAEKYVVEKLVGEGGFAVVYRAQHAIWKKPVAIKFFSELSNAPEDQRDELQEAFINEGALLTELSSQTAAIVQARDVGTYTTPGGRWMPYMVLEWLEGRSLEEILESERQANRHSWSVPEMMRILAPVAAALDVAHGRGIAHRDVKPPNIFVLGEDPRHGHINVKILDFGVAKMITDNTQMKAALAKTGTNITSFTPQYGAPEQFSRSYGATGPWTDVFALGLVAVEMLLGRVALEGDDLIQLAFAAGNPEKRPTPRALGIDVTDAVEEVFKKAFSVNPVARYQRCGEFWQSLEAAAGGKGQTVMGMSDTVAVPSGLSMPGIGPVATAKTEPGMRQSVTTNSPAMLAAQAEPAKKPPVALIAGGAVLALVLGVGAIFALKSGGGEAATNASGSAPATSASAAPVAKKPECPKDMTMIPAGQYYMGSDSKDARDNEKPTHNVMLDAFCFDTYEVTAGNYRDCSDNGACRRLKTDLSWKDITEKDRTAYGALCNVEADDRKDHPMNCISWVDADTYCRKMDKRLPTEAEWEYATRGPDGRIYPWGDDDPTPQHLNACDKDCADWAKKAGVGVLVLFETKSDGFSATAPVGKFPKGRSRFGPWDVVGNVWEWVSDWEGSYNAAEKRNPLGPGSGDKRVIRGGAWNGADKSWLRPSYRYATEPTTRSPGIGFRCAKAATKD
jgi:formylglycine-generating enzyme required for sulfatase activity/serine/threonine protein kinase